METRNEIEYLRDEYPNIWKKLDRKDADWIDGRAWALFLSVKYGRALIEALMEYYTIQEDYEECEIMKLTLQGEYLKLDRFHIQRGINNPKGTEKTRAALQKILDNIDKALTDEKG